MSTTIDQRVVEMRFDNKHFESNVSTTLSTLDKLKQKLHLNGATKGLEDVNSAAKNVKMDGLGSAVEAVSAKFSALQVMGVTALANITNSAVNAGKRIVKSLTVDPIKSGFEEYETKMGSIQTILANTEHQGTTLNDVTAALDKLNTYADKTIYNFQQMTRNIGTFTAAGVDLETSVRSIQGIANLAAVSGSTSQQASTAMYQLSQALASGTVKLMDWNSVVNAGMGGKVFQNALIRTAAMLDGAASDVEAWQKKNVDAYGSFRESLSQGAWLTAEVLTKTLEQFTMAAEEGTDEWEAYKKSLMDTGYSEKQAEEILKMANTATDAATKVKTFTQLMDTLKESAQSGWAQTWELLVGDFEEAKEFFTQLSDLFGGIIGESADRRNTFFSDALTSNWDKLIGKINEAGIETSKF
jgi:tape measure domain-containing protein